MQTERGTPLVSSMMTFSLSRTVLRLLYEADRSRPEFLVICRRQRAGLMGILDGKGALDLVYACADSASQIKNLHRLINGAMARCTERLPHPGISPGRKVF